MVNDYYATACAIKSTPFFLTPWWCSSSAAASATVVAVIVDAVVAGFLLGCCFSSSLLSYLFIVIVVLGNMLFSSPAAPHLHRPCFLHQSFSDAVWCASVCICALPPSKCAYSIYYISGLLPRIFDSLASIASVRYLARGT